MSKAEILQELPKLTKEERKEIRLKLAELDPDEWLDEDDPLTDEEKKLVDARLAEHEANPESAISLEEFNARIQKKFGDRKSTRLNSSHTVISYAVFCLK